MSKKYTDSEIKILLQMYGEQYDNTIQSIKHIESSRKLHANIDQIGDNFRVNEGGTYLNQVISREEWVVNQVHKHINNR